MNKKLKSSNLDNLLLAVSSLKTTQELDNFFQDVCTVAELKSMAQRFEVATLLNEGVTYNEISQATGASTATISRVARSLFYGADGYKIALERLNGKS